ncbi:MAG: flagellar motor switch protein FliG [Fimbriimonadaceae bacterium]|nr:flagellar motor switch protein FliG [Fimbriimonadaceae bacterium]
MRRSAADLTNRQKASVLLMILGPSRASKVMQHLPDEYIEALSLEMARLGKVGREQKGQVVSEFHELAMAQDIVSDSGLEAARALLEEAFGADKAQSIIGKVVEAMKVVPFDFLKNADPAQVLSIIQDEHPQTIALILAYLPLMSAGSILTKLPTELRADVAERIAMMDQTPPEVIQRVERVLEKKVSSLVTHDMTQAGGPKALVEMLHGVDRSTERVILDGLAESNPELAEAVKNMMFVFEDVVQLDDRAIQAILKEVDMKELGTALKGVSKEVQEKIFRNMSERAVGMLKEEMEYMGPTRLKVVEEAQQRIVATIRKLEEAGEIQVTRSGEEDVLV